MMELFLFFLAGAHLQQMIRAAAASTTMTRLALSGTAFALAYALHVNGYITSVGAATITLSALGLFVGITLTSQLQALRIFAPSESSEHSPCRCTSCTKYFSASSWSPLFTQASISPVTRCWCSAPSW
ncbi:hypothetical protein ACETU7_07880 [Rhodococcus sp. 3Y1]